MTIGALEESNALLQSAVDRLVSYKGFMAHLLSLAFCGDVSSERISSELGCSQTTGIRLALMKAPRSGNQEFRSDIATIAAATGIDQVKLMSIVRQGKALDAFGESNETMLLAARDVINHGDDPDDSSS